jgi:hypothetical protein
MSIRGLAVGCLVSLVMACGHDASRGWEPLLEPEEGVRTKGGDTFTSRIPVAIANGEWTEADALITEALGMGLVAKAQADRWREQVRRLKEEEQCAGPGRSPPTGPRAPTADGLPRDEERTCGTEWPDHPLCAALPDEYTFATPQAALEAMKRRLEQKNLTLHRPEDATGGPCPDVGQHYNVRMNGDRVGSITCCPCCVDMADGPFMWRKCRIVW